MTPSKNTKVKAKTTEENTMTKTTDNRPDLSNALMTTGQIAQMMGVSPASMTQHKQRDDSFPQPAFSNGRVMVYWREDAEAWVKNKMKNRKNRADDIEARAQAMLEKAKRMRNK